MSQHLVTAVVAALVNLVLSLLVPCVLRRTHNSLLTQVKQFFEDHRHMLITSSVLVGVIVYLALLSVPSFNTATGSIQNLMHLH